MNSRVRRALVWTGVGAAACLPVSGCGSGDDAPPEEPVVPRHSFVSRPDLTPPMIDVTLTTAGTIDDILADADPVLLAPKGEGTPLVGLLIVKADGEPVWIKNLDGPSYDLRVQTYREEPVLTWWRGDSETGHGFGEFVLMNTAYEEVATVTTPGVGADFHDMTLTADGTALVLSYPTVAADLTGVGGPADGFVLDGVVQEVDVESGEVLFEWSAIEHVPVDQTMTELDDEQDGSRSAPLDYFHINSVTVAPDGALIVSARNTHAIYRIDRDNGDVTWTLGGSASDFEVPDEVYFAWQHDAKLFDDGTITLFDNQAGPQRGTTRGLRLALDHDEQSVSIVQEFTPPEERVSSSQGNLHTRDNGNVVIGWGSEPYFSEYTAEGDLLLDARIVGTEETDNYRAYRLPWEAQPTTSPDLVVREEAIGTTAYVSWNGATEVATWRFLAGPDRARAEPVATVGRMSFETAVDVPDVPYVAVEAVDAEGNVLGRAVAAR